MATVDYALDDSEPRIYATPRSSSSASIIQSISDVLSVMESASAVDPIDLADGQKSPSATSKARGLKPHARYYMRDGMVDVGVEDTEFRVPLSILTQNSVAFRKLIQSLENDSPEPESTLFIEVKDEDVTSVDFERLLEVLFPLKFGKISVRTLEEWTSVLHLASKWSFHAVRALAIERLAVITSPVDRVVLGRRYDIQEWLLDAYISLCKRPEPLTLEEGVRMTTEDIIKIGEARHRVRVYSGLIGPEDLQAAVGDIFGVSVMNTHSNVPASISENPRKASAPEITKITLIAPSPVSCEELSQPLDLTRAVRLIKTVAEKRSNIAKAGLKELILPYRSHSGTIDTILKLLSERILDGKTHPKALAELAVLLSQVVDPGCTDSTLAVQPGKALTGSSWLTHRLVSHCNTAVGNWKMFENGSNLAQAYQMTSFFSALVSAGLVQGDVFVPCWEAILRSMEQPITQWTSYIGTYFGDGRCNLIHTESCSLLIDEFYHRVESRLAEYSDSYYQHSDNWNIQRSLRGIMNNRTF